MKAAAALVVLAGTAAVVTGCGGASHTPKASVSTPPQLTASYSTAAAAGAASCAAFTTFENDLKRLTSHAHEQLLTDAEAVAAPFTHATRTLEGKEQQQAGDGSALVAEVASPSWPTTGGVDDPAVQTMRSDCGS